MNEHTRVDISANPWGGGLPRLVALPSDLVLATTFGTGNGEEDMVS